MKHFYTSEDNTSGIWTTEGEVSRVLCDWWWDAVAKTLYVSNRQVTRSWRPRRLEPEDLNRIISELPRIALEIAEWLERDPRQR